MRGQERRWGTAERTKKCSFLPSAHISPWYLACRYAERTHGERHQRPWWSIKKVVWWSHTRDMSTFTEVWELWKVKVYVSSNEVPQIGGDLSLQSVALQLWKRKNNSSWYLSEAKGGQSHEGLRSTQIPEWQGPEKMSIENDSSCLWSRLSTARNKLGTGPPTKPRRQIIEKLHVEWAPAHHAWHGRVQGRTLGCSHPPMLRPNHGWAARAGASLALLRCQVRKPELSPWTPPQKKEKKWIPTSLQGPWELATGEGPFLVSL